MKPLKLGLRVWFTITSLVSFLAGWMLLAHAGKPTPLIPSSSGTGTTAVVDASGQLAPLPTLPPVPSLNQLVGSSGNTGASTLQSLPSLPSTSSGSFLPSFRSRGS